VTKPFAISIKGGESHSWKAHNLKQSNPLTKNASKLQIKGGAHTPENLGCRAIETSTETRSPPPKAAGSSRDVKLQQRRAEDEVARSSWVIRNASRMDYYAQQYVLTGKKMYPPPAAAAARLGLSTGLGISSSAPWLRFAIRSIHHLSLAYRQLVWIDGRQHRSRIVSSVSTMARLPSSSPSWDTHSCTVAFRDFTSVGRFFEFSKTLRFRFFEQFRTREPQFLLLRCSRIRGPPVPYLEMFQNKRTAGSGSLTNSAPENLSSFSWGVPE